LSHYDGCGDRARGYLISVLVIKASMILSSFMNIHARPKSRSLENSMVWSSKFLIISRANVKFWVNLDWVGKEVGIAKIDLKKT
jgi:hypothetical protein